MASRWRMPVRSIWQRKSGPASMTIRTPHASTMAEVRRRLSRLSAEVQTLQRHPMTGTPCEVPVPRKVSFMQAKIVKIGRLRTGTPKNLPQCTGSAVIDYNIVHEAERANTPSRRLPAKPEKTTGESSRNVPASTGKARHTRPAYPETPGNPAPYPGARENPGTPQLRETQ